MRIKTAVASKITLPCNTIFNVLHDLHTTFVLLLTLNCQKLGQLHFTMSPEFQNMWFFFCLSHLAASTLYLSIGHNFIDAELEYKSNYLYLAGPKA